MVKEQKKHKFSLALYKISQFYIGLIFMFSSVTKASKFQGFVLKIHEYLTVFNIKIEIFSLNYKYALYLFACLIILCELFISFSVLSDYKNIFLKILSFVFILCMTFITLFLLTNNRVKDCGCFGDILIMSNTGSFIKNITLLIGLYIYFKTNKQI